MSNNGRMITKEELELLSTMNTSQRLKYVREELNKLFPREFSKKRVVETSQVISYQGLHYLEEKQPEPTMNTLKGLAKFYGVPVEVFSDEYYVDKPEPFFIGKAMVEISDTTIYEPDYELVIDIRVRKEGKELVDFQGFSIPEKIHQEVNYLDLFGVIKVIENQIQVINEKNEMAIRAKKALQFLTNNVDITKEND